MATVRRAALLAWGGLLMGATQRQDKPMRVNVVGIPSHAGALESGTELAPHHLRAAGLLDALTDKRIEVHDLGDLRLPGLPRHNVAPVRNWPSPRLVWEAIASDSAAWFKPGEFTLIIGGDCSIVTGTASALAKRYPDDLQLVVLDAHVDEMRPDPNRSAGAAGMGLWFLLQTNEFWPRPQLDRSRITVVGAQMPSEMGLQTVSLQEIRKGDPKRIAELLLSRLPPKAHLFIHFDVDVIRGKDMPAAYSPSEDGLALAEAEALLTGLLLDSRVVGAEITEMSAAHDPAAIHAKALAQLLSRAVAARARRQDG